MFAENWRPRAGDRMACERFRRSGLILQLSQECQRFGHALVRISGGNVVRVTADHNEPRIRDLHLIGPFLFRPSVRPP